MQRIMIVDDSPDSRDVLEELLRDAGYGDLVLVESAGQAFEYLGIAQPGGPRGPIGLVLLDIDLPGMDGIRVCAKIRQEPLLRGVPIIMVTAMGEDDESLEASFEVGADDYVRKPINPVELVARVRSALARKEERDRLAQEKAALEFQIGYDTLTGVPRRRAFMDVLGTEWRRAARTSSPISFLMLDLDNFSGFNEAYGHLAGDACLRSVARTMEATLRRGGDAMSRLGGEEFGVLLPGTDATRAAAMGELLRGAVQALGIPHRRTAAGVVTTSVGVATFVPRTGSRPDVMMKAADAALFEAKAAGRNRVHVAPEEAPAPLDRHAGD
jgi:two-component system chemotaxis family response regulator WspR